MPWTKILAELKQQPTVSVPTAGRVLGDLSRNASYDAARRGVLGVPVITVGGKKRVPSVAVLKKLGLLNEDNEAA
jgi:hypothetical protein